MRAPTTSGGTTFGPGTENNLLKSNGASVYWATLAASDIPTISITDKTSGTLTVARGGTGQTSVANIQAGKDGDGNTISSTYLKLSGGEVTGTLTASAASNSISDIKCYKHSSHIGAENVGWVKFASYNLSSSTNYFCNETFDFFLTRRYGNNTSEAYNIRTTISWNKVDILQLGGNANTQKITKFRVVRDNTNHKVFFEYYVIPNTNSNNISIKIISYFNANIELLEEAQTEEDSSFTDIWEINLNKNGEIAGNITGTAANITGTVAIENGGTNATTAAGARTNLGLGSMATETATNYLNLSSNNTITGKITLTKPINSLLTGTGTAGTAGSSSVAYTPTLWTFNTNLTPTAGDIITIKIPVAGVTSGVWMSIDNGENYYPVALQGATRYTTTFGVNYLITLIYETGINTTTYGTTKNGAAAGASTSTYTGPRWRILNYYDSNSTYSAMSKTEAWTGTATSSRAMRADYLKQILANLGGINLTLTHNSTDGIVLNHDASGVTAITTAALLKGTVDAQGHITGTTSVTASDIPDLGSTYLKLSGGTVSPQAGSWFEARDKAIIKTTTYSSSPYYPLIDLKTTNGDWAYGVYVSDTVYFTYIPDSNYNSGSNPASNEFHQLSLSPTTIALKGMSLVVQGNQLQYAGSLCRTSSLVKGTNPSSIAYLSNNFAYSSAGIATANRIGGGWESSVDTEGKSRLALRTYQFSSGSNYAEITLDVKKDGTSFCSFSNGITTTFNGNVIANSITADGLTLNNALAVQYGGTGASTAANARNNLKAAAYLDLYNISQPTIAKILTAINETGVIEDPILVNMSSEVVTLLTNNSTIGALTGILHLINDNTSSPWLSFIGIPKTGVSNLYTFHLLFSNGSITHRELYKASLTSI